MSRRHDPRRAREADRYEHPIASRELILERLESRGTPLSGAELADDLGIDDARDRESLRRRLRAMCRDGQLLLDRRGRYALIDRLALVRGRIQGHRDGYGWLLPEDGSDDVHVHERQLHGAMDGDLVLVRISGERRDGKREGVVAEVVERAHPRITGRFAALRGVGIVEPANRRVAREILVRGEHVGGAQPGDWVEAVIEDFGDGHGAAWARIDRVLGSEEGHGLKVDVVLGAQGIPREWPKAVKRAVKKLPTEVPEADKRARVDLRDLELVTIDGEDARDFDDAVYCERRKGGGWRLLVAIADVSHYVEVGSALDESAADRGNSVYLPGAVIPMLPEELSNELCSLKPRVDRLAMVCEMSIGARGRLTQYRFYEAVIRSAARLTYTRVARCFEVAERDGADACAAALAEEDAEVAGLAPRLLELHALYRALRTTRDARGAIDFESTETRIELDDAGDVASIVPVARNDAHRLIEECMITANVASARFLAGHELPGLYRNHGEPDPARIDDLRGFLAGLGLVMPGAEIPKPADLQAVVERARGRSDRQVIETVILRSMNQAEYGPDNQGHFGLALTAYTHFTSPIRRYADLLVHRAIRSVIRSRRASDQVQRVRGAKVIPGDAIYPYETPRLKNLGEWISATERRADAASRDMDDWLKCEFMQKHLGQEHAGTVTGVVGFGLFVEIDALRVTGLVHVSMLPGDYYQYDPVNQRLTGDTSRVSFGLGDRLQVQVARVDVDERKIDFVLLDVLSRQSAPKGARRKNTSRDRRGGPRKGAHGGPRGGARGGQRRGKRR